MTCFCGNDTWHWRQNTGMDNTAPASAGEWSLWCSKCGNYKPSEKCVITPPSSFTPYVNSPYPNSSTNVVYTLPYDGDFELYARVECDECGYYASEDTCNFSGGKISYKCPKCDAVTELADLNTWRDAVYYSVEIDECVDE